MLCLWNNRVDDSPIKNITICLGYIAQPLLPDPTHTHTTTPRLHSTHTRCFSLDWHCRMSGLSRCSISLSTFSVSAHCFMGRFDWWWIRGPQNKGETASGSINCVRATSFVTRLPYFRLLIDTCPSTQGSILLSLISLLVLIIPPTSEKTQHENLFGILIVGARNRKISLCRVKCFSQ